MTISSFLKHKLILSFLIFVLIGSGIVGWYLSYQKQEQKPTSVQTEIITAQKKSVITNLFYSGILQPITVDNVTSPADGVVRKINFVYGAKVKKGNVLIILVATKLQDDLRSAITAFLTAKDKMAYSEIYNQGNVVLYKAGVLSKEDYTTSQSSLESDQLTMLDAEYKLQQAIKEIPGLKENFNFKELSLDQIGQVKQVLAKQYSEIDLIAITDGVALAPDKSSNPDSSSSTSESKKIVVGSEVKKGQVLVQVGNLSGLSVKILVNEIDVNKLKVGQKVTVTSPALPGETFNGEIAMVGSQADTSQTGQTNLASFPIVIKVPKITLQQAQLIKVGMSAKVQISIAGPKAIVLPINAVFEKNGISMVNVLNQKTNTLQ